MTDRTDRVEAIKTARKALESQGGRHPAAKVEALVDALLAGEKPQTYGERMVQMALQMDGHISR